MASSHNNSHSEAAKTEQIITEFYAKSVHILFESRSPFMSSRNFSGEQGVSSPSSSSSSSSSMRPRDKWFNLALRECPAALENVGLWRQSNLEPMVVDVVLVQRPVDCDPVSFSPRKDFVKTMSAKERYQFGWNSEPDELGFEHKSEKIIERWIVQYDSKKTPDYSSGSRRSSNNTLHNLYKKSILLLRSLYLMVRLLPAYKLFRELNSSSQIRSFKLVIRVPSFVEPFTRREEAEMSKKELGPIDTPSGTLSLSVLYRPSLLDVSFEPSTPMSPRIISNYVGSPLPDPMRRFTSIPAAHGSPSSLPNPRQLGWSYGQYKASSPSFPFSPSPSHSDSHALATSSGYRRSVQTGFPQRQPETFGQLKKDTSFDEYSRSPNFSPTHTRSSPIHIPGNHLSQPSFRSESAPVRIPVAKLVNTPSFPSKHNLPPSPPLRFSRYSSSKPDKDPVASPNSNTVEKLFALGREDSRRFSGARLSNSPQVSFSRSSSRSIPDDFDDTEFPCPFDFDDTESGSRPESFDQRGELSDPFEGGFFSVRKSPDAAVGALVKMLKKAPPLRQDFSASVNLSEASRPKVWNKNVQEPHQILETPASLSVASSGLVSSKTTADALEELRGYKDLKNMLLRSYTT